MSRGDAQKPGKVGSTAFRRVFLFAQLKPASGTTNETIFGGVFHAAGAAPRNHEASGGRR
jgi:hypothetical protein